MECERAQRCLCRPLLRGFSYWTVAQLFLVRGTYCAFHDVSPVTKPLAGSQRGPKKALIQVPIASLVGS